MNLVQCPVSGSDDSVSSLVVKLGRWIIATVAVGATCLSGASVAVHAQPEPAPLDAPVDDSHTRAVRRATASIDAPLDISSGASDAAIRQTPPQRKATIIGDSAMAGVRWNGALGGLRGFEADHRLESCRRLVNLSCNGREDRTPRTALTEVNLLSYAAPTDVLVIATGYNDWHVGFDWQSRMILDAARAKGYQTIAWVMYRENNTYELPVAGEVRSNYFYMNDQLQLLDASGAYPELQLWDLSRYTAGAASWFYSDGVHQRWIGSWGVADWISRHMAALDGRPCILPWNIGIGQEQSCPNPDDLPASRGYPDLSTIYDF